jgi:hypothetical protein
MTRRHADHDANTDEVVRLRLLGGIRDVDASRVCSDDIREYSCITASSSWAERCHPGIRRVSHFDCDAGANVDTTVSPP